MKTELHFLPESPITSFRKHWRRRTTFGKTASYAARLAGGRGPVKVFSRARVVRAREHLDGVAGGKTIARREAVRPESRARSAGDRRQLWVGFHCEKGLDAQVSAVYPAARGSHLIMRPHWYWFRFLRQLETGAFRDLIARIGSSAPTSLMVRVTGSYVEDPTEFDPQASLLKRDEYWLTWDDARKVLTAQAHSVGGQVLTELSEVSSVPRLAAALTQLTRNPWLWMNVYFVAAFQTANAGTHSIQPAWDAHDLWSGYLSHIAPLLF